MTKFAVELGACLQRMIYLINDEIHIADSKAIGLGKMYKKVAKN